MVKKMDKRRVKKYRLKKKYRFIFVFFFIYFIFVCMKPSGNISNIVNTYAKGHIKKTYMFMDKVKFKKIKEPNNELFAVKQIDDSSPLIYLYNTHDEEKYLANESILYAPNVKVATSYLKEKLGLYGLKTISEDRSIRDVLSFNGWSYGSSYKVSRMYLEDTLKTYPTLKYFFDIHRDSGSHERTTICENNKCYAKILFLIGLENSNYSENEKFANELSTLINEKINNLSKGVIGKKGKGVNGIYNEDFSPNLLLIEVGGENNTIDEVYNTIDILSTVLSDYIKERL